MSNNPPFSFIFKFVFQIHQNSGAMPATKTFIKLNGAKEDEKENTEIPKVPKNKVPHIISGSKAAMEGQGRGVVYLSHIPHGFYEKQMNKFFSQVLW